MKITIMLVCYNEEIMLRHAHAFYHLRFPNAKFVLIDQGSTDGTLAIASDLGFEVKPFTKGGDPQRSLFAVKNHYWKGYPGWVIVADMDEWLDIDEKMLAEEDGMGATIIKTKGVQMVADSQETDLSDLDFEMIEEGYCFDPYDKTICFKNSEDGIQEINFGIGAHFSDPKGRLVFSIDAYYLRHVMFVGKEFHRIKLHLRTRRYGNPQSEEALEKRWDEFRYNYPKQQPWSDPEKGRELIMSFRGLFRTGPLGEDFDPKRIPPETPLSMSKRRKYKWSSAIPRRNRRQNSLDDYNQYPKMWMYLKERFSVGSVIDIGCGKGLAVKFFRELGCEARGVDWWRPAIESSPVREFLVRHDYESGPYVPDGIYDLCWCHEFVEHVYEGSAQNFLDTFKRCKVVAMSHAVPAQPGIHHVNCREPSYWIELMRDNGFELDREPTMRTRALAQEDRPGQNYYSPTGMVFVNQLDLE